MDKYGSKRSLLWSKDIFEMTSKQLLKQTHATVLFLANRGSGRLTYGDARKSYSTGR